MNTKTIFSALALAVALGAAAPAFADRYDNPEQYGVEYTGDATSVSLAENSISIRRRLSRLNTVSTLLPLARTAPRR